MIPVITIDGPSGAGKGTVCRILAQKKSYRLLDSGAMYRITALAALKHAVDLRDEKAVASLASSLNIEFRVVSDTTLVLLDGEDVSESVRLEETGMAASTVAALPQVRLALLDRQRAFAVAPGLVADGRDMGTVVFPEAEHKFFLTASAEERARRRILQLENTGTANIDEEKILSDIKERDYKDTHRAASPLVPADSAVVIDSTNMNIDQVVAEIEARL